MPLSTPPPSPSASTSAWNGVASPPSSEAAQTDTAVPSSTSRSSPITPPAPQPTSSAGPSVSCTRLERRLRRRQVGAGERRPPRGRRRARRARRGPRRRPPSRRSARPAPSRARCRCVRPWPTTIPRRDPRAAAAILPAVPALPVVALFGPTGVGKTEVAIALAERLRADGEDPVAVSADALQLYAGLEILTGAATAAERARLEHRLLGILPVTGAATAGDYARRAHAEIDALVAAGRRPIVVGGTGLYLRAALAELDAPPAARPGRPRALRRPPRGRGRARAARRARRPRARRRGRVAARRRAARRPRARAARRGRATPPRRRPAVDGRDPPARPCSWPSPWTARRSTRRIDARVEAMVAAGAADEVRRADAAGASPSARQALGFAELLRGDVAAMQQRTRRYAKRQLTWLRKLPGHARDRRDRPRRSVRGGRGPLRPARRRRQRREPDEARKTAR